MSVGTHELEMRLAGAKVMARRLWAALKARTGLEAEALFAEDALSIVDKAYDAAETLWDRHRVSIQPCRQVADSPPVPYADGVWAAQPEMYLGVWPDGSTRNVTREQLLMMGGRDPDE